jgi:TetR/AcrR family transcriptional regulator, ethionamide resistance regulator
VSVICDTVSHPRATKRLVAEPEPIPRIGRSERTRAEILDAAFEYLWSRPFRDMTVNSLMATTSISRSAFYRYFDDIHELMQALLTRLESEILEGASPWLSENGDPVALLYESLAAEVRICYRHGPFIKAISDAAGTNAQLEDEWNWFLDRFDDAVSERIVADQELGLIEAFDPRPVATALNRVDAAMYVRAFGHRPRSRPEPIQEAITRVWISTLYGQQWVTSRTSTLYRK